MVLSLSLATPLARAEGPDSSVAEALFQEGRRLSAEHRYAEACPKFAESQRLEPAIGTLLNLATCHAAEGKTASAWSEFTRALAEARRDDRVDAAQLAEARLAELLPQLAKLRIEVAPGEDVPGLQVFLDGQVLQKPAWGVAAPVNPGKHTLRASAPGYVEWALEVELGPSEARTQAIPALVPKPSEPGPAPASSSSPPSPTEPEPARPDAWSTQKSLAVGVGAVGVVGLATSLVLGLSAKSTFDRSAPHCDAQGCDDVGLGLRHDAVVRGNVATIVFGVGAVALAGGGVLWLTAPRAVEKTSVKLGLTPHTVVARWAWR